MRLKCGCRCVLTSFTPDCRPRCFAFACRFRWQLLQLLVHSLAVVLIPLRLGFRSSFTSTSTFWVVVDCILCLAFTLDTLAGFMTAYYSDGRSNLEADPIRVARHYFMTWGVFDAISALPLAPILELTVDASDAGSGRWALFIVRLISLLRVAKFAAILRQIRVSPRMQRLFRHVNPSQILLFELLLTLLLAWHWIACIFWFLYTQSSPSSASIAYVSNQQPYPLSLHWAISVTTGLGTPIRATNEGQSFYEGLVVCLGIGMQSFFFGTVSLAREDEYSDADSQFEQMPAICTEA